MRRAAAIAAVLLAAAVVVVFATGADGGDDGAYRVRAIFDTAAFIVPGEDVKVAGVRVGKINKLSVTPDYKAAVEFTIEEPGYQAGAYRDVLLRRWHNSLGRTMWDFTGGRPDRIRYLVLGFMEATTDAVAPPLGDELITSGPLLSDDGRVVLGAAVLLEAPHADGAREVLAADRYVGIEVHHWQFGGRQD